jgi:hypothetical protein
MQAYRTCTNADYYVGGHSDQAGARNFRDRVVTAGKTRGCGLTCALNACSPMHYTLQHVVAVAMSHTGFCLP